MTQIHTFQTQNDWSQQGALDAFWNDHYQRMFPTMSGVIRNKKDGRGQRLGVDAVIVFPNGKTVSVDEKTRRRLYNDICLEHTSSDTPYRVGWVEKDLAIDYLAYGFIDSDLAFFLPWPVLQKAWFANRDEWKAKYRAVVARNPTYNTLSTAVPIHVLFEAMSRAMCYGYGERAS